MFANAVRTDSRGRLSLRVCWGNIALPHRRMFANAVRTGGETPPLRVCGDGCFAPPKADGEGFIFGDFSAIFAVFGFAETTALCRRSKVDGLTLWRQTCPHHPLSRELSQRESLEDTAVPQGARRECGCSLPHSSLAKVLEGGLRGKLLSTQICRKRQIRFPLKKPIEQAFHHSTMPSPRTMRSAWTPHQ